MINNELHMIYQCPTFQYLRTDPNLFSTGSVKDFMQRDPQAILEQFGRKRELSSSQAGPSMRYQARPRGVQEHLWLQTVICQ